MIQSSATILQEKMGNNLTFSSEFSTPFGNAFAATYADHSSTLVLTLVIVTSEMGYVAYQGLSKALSNSVITSLEESINLGNSLIFLTNSADAAPMDNGLIDVETPINDLVSITQQTLWGLSKIIFRLYLYLYLYIFNLYF
jgi:hypothetical protein